MEQCEWKSKQKQKKTMIVCRDNLVSVSRDTLFSNLVIKVGVWWQLGYLNSKNVRDIENQ